MSRLFAVTTMRVLSCLILAIGTADAELNCPQMPDKVTQVNRDVRSDVDVEIGALGKLKAGTVGAKTDVVAKNLFDKYPNTDRVLIAQMMSATYCEMIRDSKSVKDSEKLRLWSEFSERVFKFENPDYRPAPARPTQAPKGTDSDKRKQPGPSDGKAAIEKPAQTPPVTINNSPGGAVSIGQRGGITAGVLNIGPPPPPPLEIKWRCSENTGPNPSGEYQRVVTVTVNTNLTPVSLAVIADTPVSIVQFANKNGLIATNVRFITQDTAAVLYYEGPTLTPFDELYVTIGAKKPFSVTGVKYARINGLNF